MSLALDNLSREELLSQLDASLAREQALREALKGVKELSRPLDADAAAMACETGYRNRLSMIFVRSRVALQGETK